MQVCGADRSFSWEELGIGGVASACLWAANERVRNFPLGGGRVRYEGKLQEGPPQPVCGQLKSRCGAFLGGRRILA